MKSLVLGGSLEVSAYRAVWVLVVNIQKQN